VINFSFHLLKEIENCQELKGTPLEIKVATIIFMASRKCKKEKKTDEICIYTKASVTQINQYYTKLKNHLVGRIDSRVKPSDIVKRACFKLKYPHNV